MAELRHLHWGEMITVCVFRPQCKLMAIGTKTRFQDHQVPRREYSGKSRENGQALPGQGEAWRVGGWETWTENKCFLSSWYTRGFEGQHKLIRLPGAQFLMEIRHGYQ